MSSKRSSKSRSKASSESKSSHSKEIIKGADSGSSISVTSAILSERGPDLSKFTPEELSIFDPDGFTRTFLTIKFGEINDAVYDGMYSITRLQYALPIRYLKPVEGTYSYVSQKAYVASDNDMRNAAIVIEPLNASFSEMIPYTPINQHIPLNTPVTIDVTVPFETLPNGLEPERRFIWSCNLKTDNDIEKVIKEACPTSIRTKPWQECVHYGAIDIGSRLECKFLVSLSDPNISRSFNLYGFRFDHDAKELVIWVFKCFNLTPVDILKMILENPNVVEPSKILIKAILEKVKSK